MNFNVSYWLEVASHQKKKDFEAVLFFAFMI